MLELRQRLEKRATELMKARARDQCRDLLAAYAACMKVEGYLGPFKCNERLVKLNSCLKEFTNQETCDAILGELLEEREKL